MRQGLDVDRLFASDLDGTLIDHDRPDAAATAAWIRWREDHPRVAVAYVTGRHFELALEGIAAAGLPLPEFLVTDVGTAVRRRILEADPVAGGEWALDGHFDAVLRERLGQRPLEDIDAVATALDGVRAQPLERSGPFKRSFFVDPSADLVEVSARVEAAIEGLGLGAHLVASRDPQSGDGLIDVLVRDVTKATAIAHLRDELGLRDDQVVFAGDSGNDRAALGGPWHGIVVGNASADLLHLVEGSSPSGRSTRTVLARARTVAGVLEGLQALGWDS